MSHIGFSELILILIVGICVLKPEQLQQSTFFLGRIWTRTRHQIAKLKAEFYQQGQPPSL